MGVPPTPAHNHAWHNAPQSVPCSAGNQAAQNGRSARRAIISHPAPRAPARRRRHNAHCGRAIRRIISKRSADHAPRTPNGLPFSCRERARITPNGSVRTPNAAGCTKIRDPGRSRQEARQVARWRLRGQWLGEQRGSGQYVLIVLPNATHKTDRRNDYHVPPVCSLHPRP